jgi:aspartate dehydrogenase
MSKKTLAIIGAGCIGRRIARSVAEGELPYTLAAVCDIDETAAKQLAADFAPEAEILDLDRAAAAADVVVEAAAGAVVPAVVDACRRAHNAHSAPGNVVVMSVGGLLGVENLSAPGPVINVPSGAVGGLDAVQSLAVAGLDEVHLVSRKPPAGLGMELDEEKVLFEGTAAEVIKLYPKNVNVAIALSLAGLGAEKTMVKLVADPKVDRNTHHITARGPAGEIEFESRNTAFPENPRTSYLAALSAISSLKRLAAQLQVG